MHSYRCNMLDEHGHVIFPADIVAKSLDAAVRHAFRIRETSNQGGSPSRRVHAFEVWSDNEGISRPTTPAPPTPKAARVGV